MRKEIDDFDFKKVQKDIEEFLEGGGHIKKKDFFYEYHSLLDMLEERLAEE